MLQAWLLNLEGRTLGLSWSTLGLTHAFSVTLSRGHLSPSHCSRVTLEPVKQSHSPALACCVEGVPSGGKLHSKFSVYNEHGLLLRLALLSPFVVSPWGCGPLWLTLLYQRQSPFPVAGLNFTVCFLLFFEEGSISEASLWFLLFWSISSLFLVFYFWFSSPSCCCAGSLISTSREAVFVHWPLSTLLNPCLAWNFSTKFKWFRLFIP